MGVREEMVLLKSKVAKKITIEYGWGGIAKLTIFNRAKNKGQRHPDKQHFGVL